MVAFCAIYTIQSINLSTSAHLSDWSLFRLATLQELVAELESQASARHPIEHLNSMSVVDAMARQISRGIRLILNKKHTRRSPTSTSHPTTLPPPGISLATGYVDELLPSTSQIPRFDDIIGGDGDVASGPEWNLESLLPEMSYLWDANPMLDQAGGLQYDFPQPVPAMPRYR